MDQTELNQILKSHKEWLHGEYGGRRADLSRANLSGAILFRANLSRADLSRANLSGADLSEADLSEADLHEANLSSTYLFRADLFRADLSWADLSWADLSGAHLSEAILSGAGLSGADLSGADLSGAVLSVETKIERSALDYYFPVCCPSDGAFIGWKKASGKIVKLLITEDAIRLSAFGRKCRCNKATVLRIEECDGTDSELNKVHSDYDGNFVYVVGTTVYVDDFCKDRKQECAPGIHFFITRQEAVNYY